jgi:ABC-type Fe3+ transport system substrate-binding protein
MSVQRDLSSSSRRSFVKGLGLLALAGAARVTNAAQRRDVVVVTSYPDEVVSRFEAAFEKAYPQWRLRIVWRMPHDALPSLRQPGPEGVDVYWTPSPRNFAILKSEGLLRKLDVDRSGLPGRIGNSLIDDPDGYYAAIETAGYGFAFNPDYLKAHGLAVPSDWADLADPKYAGHIALPNPGTVGFAPVMADIPLQAYGWEKAWAMWSAVTANSMLVDRGGTFVSDELVSGRRGVGVSIDFFVAAAIAKGAPLQFMYPKNGGVNPAQVAIMAKAGNVAGARDFVTFLQSDAGQKIITHPDIRKLPIRPSVYASLDAGYHNPFAAAAAGGYGYDSERGLARLPVIAALFHTALAKRHDKLATLWPRARAASGPRAEKARRLLGKVPLTEAEAGAPELQRVFAMRRDDPQAEAAAVEQERKWAAECDIRLAFVDKLLEQAEQA